jgi:hypothetical protein
MHEQNTTVKFEGNEGRERASEKKKRCDIEGWKTVWVRSHIKELGHFKVRVRNELPSSYGV